jgi:hypothetical protein
MALTVKFLKGMGLTDEQIEAVTEEHGNTIRGLKEERDELKGKLGDIDEITRERDKLKKAVEESGDSEYKKKYDDITKEFEDYKKTQEAKENHAAKAEAYKKALKDAGVSDKFLDKVLKITDIDSLELTKDGNFKDAEKIAENIKSEWSDFIANSDTHGADTHTPPDGSAPTTYTREQIAGMTAEQINAHWNDVSKSLANI